MLRLRTLVLEEGFLLGVATPPFILNDVFVQLGNFEVL